MDSDLAKQQLAFKKTLQNQPTIKRHLVSNSQTFSEKNKTLATTEGSSLKSSESSIESVADEFRFDSTDIRHVNSYVHAIISLLKVFKRNMLL